LPEKKKILGHGIPRVHWFRRPKTASPRNLVQRLGRLAKLIYVNLVRIDATPHQVATGFAVGVVLGIIPSFGFGGLVAVLLSLVFRINKAAAILGSLIMNPITTVPFWTVSAFLGGLITGADYRIILTAARTGEIFRSLSYSTYVYMAGNLTLAAALAVLSYGVVWTAMSRYKRLKKLRKDERSTQNKMGA
jgi:uncharacterized protein (DUF2062 family)